MRRPLRQHWRLEAGDAAPKLSADAIRTLFSTALSDMYRAEVPQYGALLDLITEVNAAAKRLDPVLEGRLEVNGGNERLNLERHGAIRLGTEVELEMMRRLFAIMGMAAVGYYDLSVAGVPVHSTAFRPVDDQSLLRNPLRIFTSLLRLDLITDKALRQEAMAILAARRIFSDKCVELIETAERSRGLNAEQAAAFVAEALDIFRWHGDATSSAGFYQRLRSAHPLLADVACFRGPHINHLTPRTLDIDAMQAKMPERGITAKAVIEGPPARRVPILLRQTSFKALEEPVTFHGPSGAEEGAHTARFGEVEQRGAALTDKGRVLYDRLLAEARAKVQVAADGSNAADYVAALEEAFAKFPDTEQELRSQQLAFFRYSPTGKTGAPNTTAMDELIARGFAKAEPIIYEDFLPVSAAGIFRSNLGDEAQQNFRESANKDAFERALGARVIDEFMLYEETEARSKKETLQAMRQRAVA